MKKFNDIIGLFEAVSTGLRIKRLNQRLENTPRDQNAVNSAESIVGKKHEKTWNFEPSENSKPSREALSFARYHGYDHVEGKGMTKDGGKNFTSIHKVLRKHGADESLINREAAMGTVSGAGGRLTLKASIKPEATTTMSNNGTEKNTLGSFESCRTVDPHADPEKDFGESDNDGANAHYAYGDHAHATIHFSVHNENGQVIGRVSAVHHDGFDRSGQLIQGGGRHFLTDGHFGNIPSHIMDHIRSLLEKPKRKEGVDHYGKITDGGDRKFPLKPYDDDSTGSEDHDDATHKYTQPQLDEMAKHKYSSVQQIVAEKSTKSATLHGLFKATTDPVGRNAQESSMHEIIAENKHISPETQHAIFNLHRGNMRGVTVMKKLAQNPNLHPDVAQKIYDNMAPQSHKFAHNVLSALVMGKACPEHIREKLIDHSDMGVAGQAALRTTIPDIAKKGLNHPEDLVREYAMKNHATPISEKANHFDTKMNNIDRQLYASSTSDKKMQMHIMNKHSAFHGSLASNPQLHHSVAESMLNHPELEHRDCVRLVANLKRSGAHHSLIDKATEKMNSLKPTD